ncbi:DUF6916 family protein [Verrucomicrobiota bacterium sgz303538]
MCNFYIARKKSLSRLRRMLDAATVTITEFNACLNDDFTLREADKEYLLKLIEATPLGHGRPNAARAPFALKFQGDPRLRAPQRIYDLSHPRLGDMSIFLVPIAVDQTGSYFEAIFN